MITLLITEMQPTLKINESEKIMSITRKIARQKARLHQTSCCGKQMRYKEGYGIYICGFCGKEKKETPKGADDNG